MNGWKDGWSDGLKFIDGWMEWWIGGFREGVKVVTTREAERLVDAVGFKESLDEEESS